jgi:pimeloyl-ACP methyl ester carboxylesterase
MSNTDFEVVVDHRHARRSPGWIGLSRRKPLRRTRVTVLAMLAIAGALIASALPAGAAGGKETGAIGGANFIIEMPSVPWNGTLVLYSHGYVIPGSPLVAHDAGDPATGGWLLANGYAIAGSSYSQNGWALQQAFHDQIALLDHFKAEHPDLKRTIAWGHSLGGMITAGLVQLFPQRFAGAIPMCGVVAGGPGVWNSGLDAEFVFKTLLAPTSALQLVNITNQGFGSGSNFQLAEGILAGAQGTKAGRARLALVAAVADTPGWFTTGAPQPAQSDYASREQNQFLWDQQVTFAFSFALRAELESRAGGNPSWNTGVDYEKLLDNSINKDEVRALYQQAGLSLEADLDTLAATPRIAAKPSALRYLEKYIVYNGDLDMPVLTMHTIGDGLVLPQDEQAYASVVRSDGDQSLLREVFVSRAGHCAFTPGETVAAFQTLIGRLKTGHWGDSTSPAGLNAIATGLGAPFNPLPAAFVNFRPSQFLRPFDARNLDEGGDHRDS